MAPLALRLLMSFVFDVIAISCLPGPMHRFLPVSPERIRLAKSGDRPSTSEGSVISGFVNGAFPEQLYQISRPDPHIPQGLVHRSLNF